MSDSAKVAAMTTVQEDLHERSTSPSPRVTPTLAIKDCSDARYFSTGSTSSNSSYRSSSLGPLSEAGSSSSRESSANFSTRRPVSGSYTARQATGGLERPKRRGYVRPQGTNFAASAQSRESVMNLGSIAHLQYYFARTGLLDGKGGQLAKKRDPTNPLAPYNVNDNFLSANGSHSDRDSAYSSMRTSPDLGPFDNGGYVESPMIVSQDGEEYQFFDDEDHPEMLPPTVSTYNDRPKPTPRLPTHAEYKANLRRTLTDAARSLAEAKAAAPTAPPSPAARQSHLRAQSISQGSRSRSDSDASLLTGGGAGPESPNQGWYEVQGVHILDVVTLAIRAARQYYTAHPNPSRLSTIKSERKIRAELLSVMEVLRRMATRNFSKGMRKEEVQTMEGWVEGCWDMLGKEEDIEKRELEERRGWTWLEDSNWPAPDPEYPAPNVERELTFLHSLNPEPELLSSDLRSDLDADPIEPSLFLRSLQNGLRLVRLHNAMVAKSKRPFGAIPKFHTDTQKPYRCADNLRFWIKAAELRWEVILKVDVMGVVNGVDAEAWRSFETAIWKWAQVVRKELTVDLLSDERPMTAPGIQEFITRSSQLSIAE